MHGPLLPVQLARCQREQREGLEVRKWTAFREVASLRALATSHLLVMKVRDMYFMQEEEERRVTTFYKSYLMWARAYDS